MKKNAEFQTLTQIDAMIAMDVKEIEKTLDVKSLRKREENAMEFLSIRKGISGNIVHKNGKNCVIIKDIAQFKEFLGNEKECVILTQDIRLSDGIYNVSEIRGKLSYFIDNGRRVYGIETIGRKDNKGRKMEFFLDFSLNPQGFKIKTQ